MSTAQLAPAASWKTESQTGHERLVNDCSPRSYHARQEVLFSVVILRDILRADAAGATRRPAGISKDGSLSVGADYEEGVERRSGKKCCVRRELDAGLANQSGGKRERRAAAATAAATTRSRTHACARAHRCRYPVSASFGIVRFTWFRRVTGETGNDREPRV